MLLLGTIAAIGVFVDADAQQVQAFGRSVPALCPSAAIGVECPGCGSTRAAVLLLHGDLGAAWSLQPGIFPLFGLVVLFFLPASWRPPTRRWAFAAAAGLYLISWIPF